MTIPRQAPLWAEEELTVLEEQERDARIADFVFRERARGAAFQSAEKWGHFERLDVLDLLLAVRRINKDQHRAGKRYQSEYSRFFDVGRFPSTLEFHRSQHSLDGNDRILSAGLDLARTHSEAFKGDVALIRIAERVCGRDERVPHHMMALLLTALTALGEFYALPVSADEIEAATPKIRSLRERGLEAAEYWRGSDSRVNRARSQIYRVLDLLWDAQNSNCSICGFPVQKRQCSLEHVVPFWRGGLDVPGNILISHRLCNSRKNNAMPSAYQKTVLRSVNLLLGWEEEVDDAEMRYQHLMDAISRLQNPVAPAPRSPRAARWAFAPADETHEITSTAFLEKPSRNERHMHEKWLADQGVLRSNRTMRARGVNARSRRK